jgi:hypothetical protein
MAIKEGDADILWYGPEAVDYKTKLRIKSEAEAEVRKLMTRAADAKVQLGFPCYRAVI